MHTRKTLLAACALAAFLLVGTLFPAAATPELQITNELLRDLQGRSWTFDDPAQPGSMAEFRAAHPDFLFSLMRPGWRNALGHITLYEAAPCDPAQYLVGMERMEEFVQNVEDGRADCIAVVHRGEPIPAIVTTFRCDGTKGRWEAREYTIGAAPSRSVVMRGSPELSTEWVLVKTEDWEMRFPRFGYAPARLPLRGGASRDEARQVVDPLVRQDAPEMTARVADAGTQQIDGRDCWVFEGRMPGGAYNGVSHAVAADLSRYYTVEQVNGSWLLLAVPAPAPKKAG